MCKGCVLFFFLLPVSTANCLQSLSEVSQLWCDAVVICRCQLQVCMYAGLAVPSLDCMYIPSSQFTDLWACFLISTACCLQHWNLVLTWLFVWYWPPPSIGFYIFFLKVRGYMFCTVVSRQEGHSFKYRFLIGNSKNVHSDNSSGSIMSTLCGTSDRGFGSLDCCYSQPLHKKLDSKY